MITEKELLEAIAECQGTRNPNANTCAKLASYYTILDHIAPPSAPDPQPAPTYSFAAPVINLDSGSDFAEAANGKDLQSVLGVVDELMATLSVVNPRLYASAIRKLEGI